MRAEEGRVSGALHFRSSRSERQPAPLLYPDPMPASMAGVSLDDLCSTDINWRMLTMARPRGKQEEEFFSK